MVSPASLRDLYSTPSTSWNFNQPMQSAGPSKPSSSAPAWSTVRPSNSPIFDLAPILDYGGGSESATTNYMFKALISSAFLQCTTTAIAMPWEVGKILLQIQWIPKDPEQDIEEDETVQYADQESMSESSMDESYFQDPISTPALRRTHRRGRRSTSSMPVGHGHQRQGGGAVQLPPHIIPYGPSDGVFGMMKRVGAWKTEGWLSLWKGILTSCINEALSSNLQPLVLNALRPFNPPGSLLAPVLSHMATGFILSPLDLLRTRQIVHPRATRPSGFAHFAQIIREEGGLKAVYLDSRFLFPTLLDHSVRPLIALALPGLIQRHLGLRDAASNPLTFPLAEFAGACAGLLVTLPIETIRRRLQVQSRSGKVETCVRVRPWPYVGVVDALWRILSEERSAPPRRRRRIKVKGRLRETEFMPEEEEGWLASTGLGQLFRGFGMGVGALVLVLAIALTTGGENEGWAEL